MANRRQRDPWREGLWLLFWAEVVIVSLSGGLLWLSGYWQAWATVGRLP